MIWKAWARYIIVSWASVISAQVKILDSRTRAKPSPGDYFSVSWSWTWHHIGHTAYWCKPACLNVCPVINCDCANTHSFIYALTTLVQSLNTKNTLSVHNSSMSTAKRTQQSVAKNELKIKIQYCMHTIIHTEDIHINSKDIWPRADQFACLL